MFSTDPPSPFGLHGSMFTPTILKQGTPQQKKKWLPLAKSFSIVGTYAQSELGHGKANTAGRAIPNLSSALHCLYDKYQCKTIQQFFNWVFK